MKRAILAITLASLATPRPARAIDGSQEVFGGGIITFTGATETNWVANADGRADFLIKFADTSSAGSLALPLNWAARARILAIGGGGGGGGSYSLGYSTNYGGGGGGGAGGFVEREAWICSGVHLVTVGRGGAGGPRKSTRKHVDYTGAPGTNTTITCNGVDWITAYGGGGGGGETVGMPGGSGGGGSMLYVSNTDGTENAGGEPTDPEQGHAGGAGDIGLWGGGGGGAGAAGEDASAGATGGDGRQSDITLPAGTAQADWPWYAGGGGGGHTEKTATQGVAGGKGGGGMGGAGQTTSGKSGVLPEPGDPQTGGGGGAGNATVAGADGGSGVVYVRISEARCDRRILSLEPDGIIDIAPRGGLRGIVVRGKTMQGILDDVMTHADDEVAALRRDVDAIRMDGAVFDFSDNKAIYTALRSIIINLGGSVTNFPSFQQ